MEPIEIIRQRVDIKLEELMKDHKDDDGHGLNHFMAVGKHAIRALNCEDLPIHIKLQIELAARLHDVDDPKIFTESINYQNAYKILKEIFIEISFKDIFPDVDYDKFIQGIIDMIKLVSCSQNGDDDPIEKWMAIPRDCDRLEAIGKIGIKRCHEFTLHSGNPLHDDDTVKVYTEEELWKVATRERFNNYKIIKKSSTMIDHYYDKLLHIGKLESLKSQNLYILGKAIKRNNLMIKFVLDYWKSNGTCIESFDL